METYDKKLKSAIESEKIKRKEVEKIGKRNVKPNFINISDALDQYYVYNKLKTYCAFLSYSIIVNSKVVKSKKTDFLFIREIIKKVEANKDTHPLISIFYNIIYIFEHINYDEKTIAPVYENILTLFDNKIKYRSLEEDLEILSLLSNVCIYRMNKNKPIYKEKLFIINIKIINLKYDNNLPIQATLFENLVATALNIHNDNLFHKIKTSGINSSSLERGFKDSYEWVYKFMRHYKTRLDENGRMYHFPYCKALYYFHLHEFDKAYKILKQHQPKGMFIVLNTKVLYLKTIYEIHEKELLNSVVKYKITEKDLTKAIDAYRVMVKYEKNKKELIGYQLEFYVTFDLLFRKVFSFYKKYFGIYKKGDKIYQKNRLNLEKEIRRINFPYKDWLLEKLENIK